MQRQLAVLLQPAASAFKYLRLLRPVRPHPRIRWQQQASLASRGHASSAASASAPLSQAPTQAVAPPRQCLACVRRSSSGLRTQALMPQELSPLWQYHKCLRKSTQPSGPLLAAADAASCTLHLGFQVRPFPATHPRPLLRRTPSPLRPSDCPARIIGWPPRLISTCQARPHAQRHPTACALQAAGRCTLAAARDMCSRPQYGPQGERGLHVSTRRPPRTPRRSRSTANPTVRAAPAPPAYINFCFFSAGFRICMGKTLRHSQPLPD